MQRSSQRSEFYLKKMTTWWLMVFFLYLLALPDEPQRIIGHSGDGFTAGEFASHTMCFYFKKDIPEGKCDQVYESNKTMSEAFTL